MPNATLVSAVPTPFTADGALDDAGLRPLYEFLDGEGVDGLFVAGTTGEFIALDDTERETVVAAALDAFGPDRVYAHGPGIRTAGAGRCARPAGRRSP